MLSTFHAGTNKPHLLANRDALPALGRALSSGDAQLRLNAASALWALVFDNQKAKAVVKDLAAQGVIALASGVLAAAQKPINPNAPAFVPRAQATTFVPKATTFVPSVNSPVFVPRVDSPVFVPQMTLQLSQ